MGNINYWLFPHGLPQSIKPINQIRTPISDLAIEHYTQYNTQTQQQPTYHHHNYSTIRCLTYRAASNTAPPTNAKIIGELPVSAIPSCNGMDKGLKYKLNPNNTIPSNPLTINHLVLFTLCLHTSSIIAGEQGLSA
jgi:hypothetical protein